MHHRRLTHVRLDWLLILFVFVAVAGPPAMSAYLTNVPQKVIQPDGEALYCLASGDEHFNWMHDEAGFVIIQDHSDGYYKYAMLVDGNILPSAYIAGRVDPASVGLVPNIRPSAARMKAMIAGFRLAEASPPPSPAPKTGTINNLVVFIRFAGESEFTDAKSIYDNMFNSTTAGYNSMRNYFVETSYTALTVSTTMYPTPPGSTVVSYQDSHPRGYYQPYDATTNSAGYTGGDDGSDRTNREHALLVGAINSVASQVPSGLNIDGDNDGNVDNVCFIVSGSPTGWASLLWPHKWDLYTQTVYLQGNKRVYTYNFQLQNSLNSSGVGVLCHEMQHSLGMPDLYHYTDNGIDPVYTWDVMDYNLNPPQHSGAYMKSKYTGWIGSIPQITTPGVYTLNPITSATGNCYKIASPSTNEFFVLEYRRKTGTFEGTLSGSGLLVYRINTTIQGNSSGPPDEVYLYRPGGTTTANGSPSSANFTSDVGRTTINSLTNPSPFLTDGTQGGLSITDVGVCSSTISFRVRMKIAAVTCTPDGGTYPSAQTVTLNCPTPGVTIYYTTNGADPTISDNSVPPGGSVIVQQTAVLKARAMATDWDPSDVKTATYIVGGQTIPSMKLLGDGASVAGTPVVTAAFPDFFYVEDRSRAMGIRVNLVGHALTVGKTTQLAGTIQTNSDGERYVNASIATATGSDSVLPVLMTNSALGGGNWSYGSGSSSGQCGIEGASGLNNIGLLVRTTGRVTSVSSSSVIQSWNFDNDPGWTFEGQWAWGAPTGSGTHNHDPSSGFTGTKVVGYNLNGDYANNMQSTLYATTPAINCVGYTGVHLTFYRWLGVEQSTYDHASIQVSSDGSTWTNVWANGTSIISESAWSLQDYNISSVADNKPMVYVRWGMGRTDSTMSYPGWNVDDVQVTGTPNYFTMTDGSSGSVKVVLPTGVTSPAIGSYIGVTGISSCKKDAQSLVRRLLRVRSSSDILVY